MKQELAKKIVREAYENPQVLSRYLGVYGLWKSEEVLIQRFFPLEGNILDLGCGMGRTSIPLTQMGFQVVGIDISLPMVKAGRLEIVQQGLRVDFLQMDATALAFAEASFDGALFSSNAMDQIPGYNGKSQVFYQVFRALRPGAAFIFSTHQIWSPVHLKTLIWGGIKLNLGKIMGFRKSEEKWGEIYNLEAKNPEERYGQFMSPHRWISALRMAGFDLVCYQSRSQLENRRLLSQLRRSISSGNFAFFVARKPD
jgi:SAM-dependent methyltransferase